MGNRWTGSLYLDLDFEEKMMNVLPEPPPVVSSAAPAWPGTPPPSAGPPRWSPGSAHRKPWPPQPESG